MKRTNNLYYRLISNSNIRMAIEEVCRSHRWLAGHKPNRKVLWIESTIDDRVNEIREIIQDGFEPTPPKIKRRYDTNARKWRDIAEPRIYPDQVVHHALIQVMQSTMMRGMDNFCCGSIKCRGTHYGIKYIKKWMHNDYNGTKWCAEFDIYHFYEQLQPSIVMDRLRELYKDNRVLDLCERVMKYGVTIGAYFSQWFANTTLQPLDVIIRECGCSHYLRYMDNFTIFASNKRALKKIKKAMEKWLGEHELKLKKNWQYFRTNKRFPNALGYRFGRTFVLLRKQRLLRIRQQIRSFYRQKYGRGFFTVKFAQSLLSRLGALRHCSSIKIYKKYVPNGLQRELKDVVREWQRKEYAEWNTYLEQYGKVA